MTADERATALQVFGYTPREAAFLALVAVHGGYFLRRQYAAFLHQDDCAVVTDLVRRLIACRHATSQVVPTRTYLYHLSSHAIYTSIGGSDCNYRHPALPLTVALRLMRVDVVLGRPHRTVLATEAEKVRFFTDRWSVPLGRLPAANCPPTRGTSTPVVHYFVDHAPILLTADSPEVTFAYVQGWSSCVEGFRGFLRRYLPLFSCLPAVCTLFCTTRPALVELAHRVWGQVLGGRDQPGRAMPTPEEAAAQFRLRRQLEQHGPAALSPQELDRYQIGHARFADPKWHQLYARWCVSGDVVLESLRRPVAAVPPAPPPRFDALVIRQSYPLLLSNGARPDRRDAATQDGADREGREQASAPPGVDDGKPSEEA